MTKRTRKALLFFVLLALAALVYALTHRGPSMSDIQSLQFTCTCETENAPKPTPEAETLFQDGYREQMQAAKLGGKEGQPLMKLALQHYEQAAKLGHWKAVRNLAGLYTEGWGEGDDFLIRPSYDKARQYAQQLADMGVGQGYALLSAMAYQGWGVMQSERTGLQYQRKAADMGNADSQANLGNRLTDLAFKVAPKDQARVLEVGMSMLACAVRQGNREAAFNLAGDYEIYVENYPYALFYYQQAGKMGDGTSLYTLSGWFKEGKYGYAKDPHRANLYKQYSDRTDRFEGPFPDLDKELPLPLPPNGGSYPPPEFGWPNAWIQIKPETKKN